uniref:Anaphase-promoting complex subunit 10 n=1 Tax=Magallana gigas TaxID=29159 RepID=K1R1C9_MAGGI
MATKVVANPEIDILKEEREGRLREVGNQAVWSLSSCKPGFGVDQLLDNTVDTYWQSDGPQPHLVNIQFRRKTTIHDVCIYTDYKADESYTPNRPCIRMDCGAVGVAPMVAVGADGVEWETFPENC